MRRFMLALALLAVAAQVYFSLPPFRTIHRISTFEAQAQAASGAIFIKGAFHCSGTEIGHDSKGNGVFLTAHHCVADMETNELMPHEMVSFSNNEQGPYYNTVPLAISSTDDLALLYVINGAEIPEVHKIGDETILISGDPVFDSSFPLGMGKLVFHGEFTAPRFLKIDERMTDGAWPAIWNFAMPMNLTIAHGSSGSGVFSSTQRALIGVAVGTFQEGSYNVAIPGSRIKEFLNHLAENSIANFMQANPVKPTQGIF